MSKFVQPLAYQQPYNKAENKELRSFFDNIQRGLETHSIKELNAALSDVLDDKADMREEIQMVLQVVSKEFGCTPKMLMQKNARGEMRDAQDLCYGLMHIDLRLKVRFIAKRIFSCWPTSVSKGATRLKKLNPKINQDKILIARYENLKQALANKIIQSKEKK